MFAARLVELLSLLPRHPAGFCDRVTTLMDTRLERWLHQPAYQPQSWDSAVHEIEKHLARQADGSLKETTLSEVESLIRQNVDMFLHDSRHTYRNISRELRAVTPYLASRSIVIADDIERNSAFQDWASAAQASFWTSIQETEKKSLTGVGLFVDCQST